MFAFKIKAEWTELCFFKENKWNLGEKYCIKKHYSVFSSESSFRLKSQVSFCRQLLNLTAVIVFMEFGALSNS